MLSIKYKPSFIRQMNKCETMLRDEVCSKIEVFKDVQNHKALRVHKLKGKFSKYSAFWVNYKIRVWFRYEEKGTATLFYIEDHDGYK